MLATGTALPSIRGKNTDGEEVDMNDLISGGWAVVLLYRGHW